MSETDISTAAVERLLDGVTPGPWETAPGDTCDLNILRGARDAYISDEIWGDANARFIAASRELVPALLSDRDRLAGEVARLRQEIANVQKVREHEHKRAEAALAEVARLLRAAMEDEA